MILLKNLGHEVKEKLEQFFDGKQITIHARTEALEPDTRSFYWVIELDGQRFQMVVRIGEH